MAWYCWIYITGPDYPQVTQVTGGETWEAWLDVVSGKGILRQRSSERRLSGIMSKVTDGRSITSFLLETRLHERDHSSMFSDTPKRRGHIFWRAFKTWAGIMSLPGAFFLTQSAGLLLDSVDGVYKLLLMAFYSVLAPGVVFGVLGAAALTFLASPATKTRTLLVGIVTGFTCPAAFFVALIVLLGPKNEGVVGYGIYGFIFALTGAFAGFEAGNAVLSEKLTDIGR